MKLNIYQVDAFSDKIFGGNPAAVVPLETWLTDNILQSIALENNLSETAFFVFRDGQFQIRWFTPNAEVDLCGHATLATSHVLFNELNYGQELISFISKSGTLIVRKTGDKLQLDFPADKIEKIEHIELINEALGVCPIEIYKGKTDYLLILDSEETIKNIRPNFHILKICNERGVIVSAKGNESDFVSRFFAPGIGINEDPVTGSAHTSLIPYWSAKLNKTELTAKQLSARGGKLWCTYLGDRVLISGYAITYMKGEINIY